MSKCPICATPTETKRDATPYFVCPNCACWFQSPPPQKTWHGTHEPPPETMPDSEKEINRSIADRLFSHWMQNRQGRTLDIGAAWPYLAHCFAALGCDAHAIDGHVTPSPTLSVDVHQIDFETCNMERLEDLRSATAFAKFDLITIIHCFEHLYDPLEALRLMHAVLAPTGHVFLRMPDHDVPGFERDLLASHYAIHPFYHSLDSIGEALYQTQTFTIAETYPLQPGQRDYVLTPS